MEEINTPDFIDMDTMDLRRITREKRKNTLSRGFDREYAQQSMVFLIKNNIINIINMINDAEDNENMNVSYDHVILLINTLIINGKLLEKHQAVILIIFHKIHNIQKSYAKSCLYKILHNITTKKSYKNIHFRIIKKIFNNNPPISEDIRKNIESTLPQFRYCRQACNLLKNNIKKFKIDQIVGARDKNNKWWMSRILHVYNDPNSKFSWYYVHFEGWSKCDREWICSSSYSVRVFNPRKHILKRS
jgi:hypothetical protein